MTNYNEILDEILKRYVTLSSSESDAAKQAILRWVADEVIEPGIKKAINILPNERNNPHASTRLKSDIKSSQLEILAEHGYKVGSDER